MKPNEISNRQKIILKMIIEEYISTAIPIGSKRLQEVMGIEISTATIRNEFVTLENFGYLEKEHTSSGRVPSTKGYRYYVDNLMESSNIEKAKEEIEKIFTKRNLTIDEVLSQSSKILSEMTKLASITLTAKDLDDVSLTKVELIPLNHNKATVIFVMSNGVVQSKMFSLENVTIEELDITIELFNKRLVNTNIINLEEKTLMIVPILKQQVKRYEFVLKNFINTIMHYESIETRTSGVQYLLQNPEFDNPEKIKQVIGIIENSSPFSWFTSLSKNGEVQFAIGDEMGIDDSNITIVGSKFDVGTSSGTLALVGPKRLPYDKISDIMKWLAQKINAEFIDKTEESD